MERDINEQERQQHLEAAREKSITGDESGSVRNRQLQKGDFKSFTKEAIKASNIRRRDSKGEYSRFKEQLSHQGVLQKTRKKGIRRVMNPDNLKEKGLAHLTAFTEIDASKDAGFFLIIMISILADIFSLVPILGSVMAVLFAILIWMMYLLGGYLKKKAPEKMMVLGGSALLELFPFLNFLPFFTASAIINYWMTLAERKVKQQEAKTKKDAQD
jgi:hypothetical protein